MDIQNKEQWNEAFIVACLEGDLGNVRHLCEKKYVDQKWANIHCFNEGGFRGACFNGQLEVVKYLLTSPELIEAGHSFADLHAEDDLGFCWACAHGHLDLVKYLLTSHELKEAGHTFANLHAKDDEGFRLACQNEHGDVVRWLVMDYGIKKTPDIEKIIQEYPQAQEYFRVQEELHEIKALIKETSVSHPKDEFKLKENERAPKKAKKL